MSTPAPAAEAATPPARSRRARRVARVRRREERQADGRVRRAQAPTGRARCSPTSSASARRSWSSRRKMLANPYRLAEAQMNLWWDYMSLWQSSMLKMMGAPAEPDRRAGAGRQALQARGLARALPVRLHQAVVPDRRALAARPGRQRRGPATSTRRRRSTSSRASTSTRWRRRTSRSPIPKCSARRSPPAARTSCRGLQQPAGRHRARQRPAQDLDDRHQGVRARRQHRDHARARSCSRTT